MTSQGRAVSWFLPLFFLASSALLSASILNERSRPAVADRGNTGQGETLLTLISRKPAFSLGFRNFLADLAWLQAVQVAGARRLAREDYDKLNLLIRTVNNFDPRFDVPYFLGGLVLGDSPDHVSQAMDTLERGWKNYPENWRFPFYMGYLRYFSLGDPVEGGRFLEAASHLRGSPPYLPMLAARMYSEGRRPETAMAFLERIAREETDPARLEVIRKRMREVNVERDLQFLEGAVAEFRKRTGAVPASLSDLVRAGLVASIPVEPNGGRYLLSADGTVRSSLMTERLKVFRTR